MPGNSLQNYKAIIETWSKQNQLTDKLDCADSAKASKLNQKWSGTRIKISGLRSGISHFAECHENWPMTV